MNLEERYAKFKKVFPTSELDLAGWKKLKSWDTPAYTLQRLDMAIFPDCLESISMENSPITVVNFIDTQTKLTSINFMYCHISKFKLPETIKKVTEVHLEGNPLFKFDLGGSVGTVEHLELPIEMPTNRVAIGEGMKSLVSLTVGSLSGAIVLHPDLVNLVDLSIDNSPAKPIKVQKTMTKLSRVLVSGDCTALTIPEEIKLEVLDIDSAEIKIPRKVDTGKLVLRIGNAGAVKIPATLVENLKELHITVCKPESLSLPKNIGAVESLYINATGYDLGSIKIDPKMKDLYLIGESVTLTGDLSEMVNLDLRTKAEPVVKGLLGGAKLRDLCILHGKDEVTPFKYPDAYPALESARGMIDHTHVQAISPKLETIAPKL